MFVYNKRKASHRQINSDAAHVARVLCIPLMSYVHLHFFPLPGADFPITEIIIVETFGRSSVPLLSVLSGFFMVGFFSRRDYLPAALERGRSLVLPMVIWNLVACVLFGFTYPLWDALLAATEPSRLIYLAFLRDLFVMSLLTPLLVAFARKTPWVFLAAIFAYYLSAWESLVVLRPQIAFFFGVGVFLKLYPQPLPKGSSAIAIIGLLAAITWQVCLPESSGFYFDYIFRRPITAFAFWVAALWIATKYGEFGRFDKAAFPFFLTHGFIFQVVGSLYSKFTMLHDTSFYYAIWLLTPPVCYAVIYLVWPLTGKYGRMVSV